MEELESVEPQDVERPRGRDSRAAGRSSSAMTWSNAPCQRSVPVTISPASARSRSSARPRRARASACGRSARPLRHGAQRLVGRDAGGRNHAGVELAPGAMCRPGEELPRGHRARPRAESEDAEHPAVAGGDRRAGRPRRAQSCRAYRAAAPAVSAVRWMRHRAPSSRPRHERPRLQPANQVVNDARRAATSRRRPRPWSASARTSRATSSCGVSIARPPAISLDDVEQQRCAELRQIALDLDARLVRTDRPRRAACQRSARRRAPSPPA